MKYKGRVVGFIDIGTNSVRLLLVRVRPDLSYSVLRSEKEIVRLGDAGFSRTGKLGAPAMKRAALVCGRFAGLARAYGATRLFPVATSATREAKNGGEFIRMLKDAAGLDVKVISGREEARLIYLGISSGFHIGNRKAVYIDIGGGSTEVAIGGQRDFSYLDSLEVGALRMTSLFDAGSGTVSRKTYGKMKLQAANTMLRSVRRIKKEGALPAFGSSGTVVSLSEIAARMRSGKKAKDRSLRLGELRKISSMLCGMTPAQRGKVFGMNPGRAQIIIGGAAILESFMDSLGIRRIIASERGLVYGMLADYLSRKKGFSNIRDLSVRQESVLRMARSFSVNESHARHVEELALQLFDSARKVGLHSFGERERELLGYAAFLHDVGDAVSFRDHHAHSCYLIKNAELLGFDVGEIRLIASVARFHGKKPPRKKELESEGFDAEERCVVSVLSGLMRLAENLDRGHKGVISRAVFSCADRRSARLSLSSRGDCELEVWGVESSSAAFEKTFKRSLSLRVRKRG